MGKKNKLIPKKVAGFKVPKSLRKSKVLHGLLASAAGRDILASALTAGAGAAAAALVSGRDGLGQGDKSRKGGAMGLVSGALHDGAGAIMQVVSGAARSVLSDRPASASGEAKGAAEPREEHPTSDEPRH